MKIWFSFLLIKSQQITLGARTLSYCYEKQKCINCCIAQRPFFYLRSMKRVHVIKATQYTGLKATPKYTGKKATKTYRNIGYNEYTGSKATAFLNTQEKRLHFLNIQEKRLHFWIYKKKVTFDEYTRYSHNENSLSAIFN